MRVQCTSCKDGIALSERWHYYSDDAGNPLYSPDHPMFSNQCCASGCLSREPDFLAQREWLREVVEDAGLMVIFYPKYHCELNFIELIWSYMKSTLRKSCTFNFADLKTKIALLVDSIPLDVFQSSARFCYRFMSGYRIGLSGPLLDFTLKKFKCHRSIPPGVVDEMNRLYVEKKSAKQRGSKPKKARIIGVTSSFI